MKKIVGYFEEFSLNYDILRFQQKLQCYSYITELLYMSLIGQKPEVYWTGITHITGYHEYYDEKKKNEC